MGIASSRRHAFTLNRFGAEIPFERRERQGFGGSRIGLDALKPLALAALTALAGCGGGTGGGSTGTSGYVPDSQLFMPGSPNATLDVIRLDPGTGLIVEETTALTAPNILTGGALDGTVTYSYVRGADNHIDLSDNSGNATINDQGTQYVFRYGASNGRVGVAGLAATNMPSTGSASYSGFADVIANDGAGSLKALTTASTTASFATGKVNVYLSNSGADWIRINGADISGNAYSGGVVSVSPTFATNPAATSSLEHKGKFFETNAREVGGVFIFDRTGAGVTFKAQGAYGGNDGS